MIQQQWLLGLLAGGTIFLGFPIALIKRVPAKTKALLNAIAFSDTHVVGLPALCLNSVKRRLVVGQLADAGLVEVDCLFRHGLSPTISSLAIAARGKQHTLAYESMQDILATGSMDSAGVSPALQSSA